MASIKTAISIEKPLFDELEALAKEMEVSRSYLITLAAREYIQRYKSQKLLEAINLAYKDKAEPSEYRIQKQMRSKQRELIKEEW
jgi:metal-responsive CopG/Arc/MetJ family transcriptional regulator